MYKVTSNLILTYLRLLATIQLNKNKSAVIIGITGSAGKSSTREAIAMILKTKGRIKDSGSANANSESGIPLNILGLSPTNYSLLDWARLIILAPLMLLTNWERFDYYVVEMGIDSPDSPKNMEYLLKIVRPHVAVILNAQITHSHSFDHLVKDRDPARRAEKIKERIAKEKLKLASGINPAGVTLINSDQKELRKSIPMINSRIIKFGRLQGAGLKFTLPKNTKSGFSFSFTYQGRTHKLSLPDHYEEAFAYTFAAAIATCTTLGVRPRSAVQALASYRAPAGRMRIFKGINNTRLIDSSYNASPSSMENALKLLSSFNGESHKLAILGDMRELGKEAKLAHKDLADQIIKHADEAILFGKLTKVHTLPVLESLKFPVKHFSKMSDLVTFVTKSLPKNSQVLIKGSQNTIFLERVVEALLADKSLTSELCRRGKYWDNIRSQLD